MQKAKLSFISFIFFSFIFLQLFSSPERSALFRQNAFEHACRHWKINFDGENNVINYLINYYELDKNVHNQALIASILYKILEKYEKSNSINWDQKGIEEIIAQNLIKDVATVLKDMQILLMRKKKRRRKIIFFILFGVCLIGASFLIARKVAKKVKAAQKAKAKAAAELKAAQAAKKKAEEKVLELEKARRKWDPEIQKKEDFFLIDLEKNKKKKKKIKTLEETLKNKDEELGELSKKNVSLLTFALKLQKSLGEQGEKIDNFLISNKEYVTLNDKIIADKDKRIEKLQKLSGCYSEKLEELQKKLGIEGDGLVKELREAALASAANEKEIARLKKIDSRVKIGVSIAKGVGKGLLIGLSGGLLAKSLMSNNGSRKRV